MSAAYSHELLAIAPVEVAKRQAILNPRCTFHSVKRFIGRSMSEAPALQVECCMGTRMQVGSARRRREITEFKSSYCMKKKMDSNSDGERVILSVTIQTWRRDQSRSDGNKEKDMSMGGGFY